MPIEKAFEDALGEGEFEKYIDTLDGKPGRKIDHEQKPRDYQGVAGRQRAPLDPVA